MGSDIWDGIYHRALERGLDRIDRCKGVALGFHSVIDGMKYIKEGLVEEVFRRNPGLLEEVLPGLSQVPQEIYTPADLMAGLLSSMIRGKALQLMIRDERAFRWTMENFGYDKLKLGGTSGNMANSLAPLGFRKVLVYANPLTRELAYLFRDDPNLYVIAQDGSLKHPREAYSGEGIFAVHWIFEYQKGTKVRLDGLEFTVPRDNRFIPAWNPVNNQLRLAEHFKEGFLRLAKSFSHFLVSGYHILSERYPDGTSCLDYLIPTADYIAEVKSANPGMKVHCEMASISGKSIRMGIIDYVLPNVYSFGLNEVELASILGDIGELELVRGVEEENSVIAIAEGMRKLADRTGVPRIHLHNLGYYIALIRKGYSDPGDTLLSLAFAATVAASRTAYGAIRDRAQVESGLHFPICEDGIAEMTELSRHFKFGRDFLRTGISGIDGHYLVFLPTRLVEKPVLMAGLGDTISSTAFLTE